MTKDVSVISIDDDTLVSTPKDKTDKPKEEIDGAAAAAAEVYHAISFNNMVAYILGELNITSLLICSVLGTVSMVCMASNIEYDRKP
jgi:hypothetical protein